MDNNNSMINRIMLLHELKIKYLNFDAIFSDETPMFRTPAEPEKNSRVAIRLRVARDNVDKCSIQLEESFIVMEKVRSTTRFDFYEGSFITGSKPVNYYFLIEKDGRKYCYNKQGVLPQADPAYNFCIMPGFHTPDWAKGAVMYQIYVDRFFDGDKNNDVLDDEYVYLGARAKMVKDWYAPLENFDVCNFYGGDLQGVMAKMHYLKSLGIDAIYFNPVFVSPSNHKYDIQDYDYIDPHYGVIVNDGTTLVPEGDTDNSRADMYMVRTTDKENLEESNKLMIRLIEMAHSMGIRIILDGVFNHCGAFNKWLDREGFYERNGYEPGAFKNENSRYRDYFKWNEDGFYDGWWGHDNHPKLNFEGSKELYDYIIGIGKKWVSPPFNADGWRLDVAADLGCSKEFNMQFWRDFRKAVKEANPDAIILAEHYGDPKDWLMGDQWDTVMNYDAFMEPITWFLTGMEKHSESAQPEKYNNSADFESTMRYFMARFSYPSLSVAMNQLSNHDHSRFLTRTNRKVGRLHTMGAAEADTGINKAIMREAILFQMTWIGAPTIYYGDEVGMTGWTDPDNRRPFPWGREDPEILDFYKEMIKIHKRYKAFSTGSLDYLYNSSGVICFGRWNEDEHIAVIINNNDNERETIVPAWAIEAEDGDIFTREIISNHHSFTTDKETAVVKEGTFTAFTASYGCAVWVSKKGEKA
ncbi:MAG: glycoside hydrolase family 13 protein [Firmicutes bacterium]|nr:glycoside hydrolase family 13 protein [Bacillota bacterium]